MNRRWIALVLTTGLAVGIIGSPPCRAGTTDPVPSAQASSAPRTSHGEALTDAPLEPHRRELLEIAFDVATAIPISPHVKTRSRKQQDVVAACLELDQPLLALDYLQGIGNWRQGACYAELALYCARHGLTVKAREFQDEAYHIAWGRDLEDWRRDRVRVKIAMTYVILGDDDKAAVYQRDIERAERGKVAALRATTADRESFDQLVEEVDSLVASGDFDLTRNGLHAYAALFDRFYDDGDRRAALEQRIKSSWGSLPLMIRVELLIRLAESSLDHDDSTKALELIAEGEGFLERGKWQPRFLIPLRAQLAGLRFRAGDQDGGRERADASRALFEAKRDAMINIDRAGALRPLAEAYHTMGDREAALAVYATVLEEGAVNPNSRPRAEDLVATCCSMALRDVEPDETLWERIREIKKGLGHPW